VGKRKKDTRERSKAISQTFRSLHDDEQRIVLRQIESGGVLKAIVIRLQEFSAWRCSSQENEDSVTKLLVKWIEKRAAAGEKGARNAKSRLNTMGASTLDFLARNHPVLSKLLHSTNLFQLEDKQGCVRANLKAGSILKCVHLLLTEEDEYDEEIESLRSKCGLGKLTTTRNKLGRAPTAQERADVLELVKWEGTPAQDLFAYACRIYETDPEANVVTVLGGVGAQLEVECLSQANTILKTIVCESFNWSDHFSANFQTAEFPVRLNEFYKERTGTEMTRPMIGDFFVHMKNERGGGLFGGFGYTFRLRAADGKVVATAVREA